MRETFPTSPFSTRFSGREGEARLRIQNIARGQLVWLGTLEEQPPQKGAHHERNSAQLPLCHPLLRAGG